MIGWGGYSALTLAAYKGDEDQYSIGVGTDSDGNAYGIGSGTVARAESSQLTPASDSELNARDIRNGTLGVQWNINALNSRIGVHEQYDPVVRARQLDREIRRGAIGGVLRHNLKDAFQDKPGIVLGFTALFDGWFLYDVANSALQKDYARAAERIGIRAFTLGVGLRGIRSLYPGAGGFQNQIIDSLFWSARPTRALAGAGVIAASRLVRPTPAKSEE